MSHFYVMALMPMPVSLKGKNLQDPDAWTETQENLVTATIADLMSPYDENTEVEEYEKECYCIEHLAFVAANKASNEKFGDLEIEREKFRKIAKERKLDPFSEEEQKLWKELTGERFAFEKNLRDEIVAKHETDPNCDDCHGTGKVMSTYNPKSKWDWYRIGGRWCSAIQKRKPADDGEGGFNFSSAYEGLAANSISVEDLLKVWEPTDAPFALVLPDGTWVERGKMGWWACVSDEKNRDDWQAQVKAILEQHRECLAVGVDCHI